MNRPLILTYDVGTQSTRAILVDKQGNIVDKEQVKYAEPYFRQRPGWAEQKTDFFHGAIVLLHKSLYNVYIIY